MATDVSVAPPAPATAGAGGALGPSPLERCFAISRERFAAEHWNSRPLLVRAADRAVDAVHAAGAGRTSLGGVHGFDDLLSPADVDELLGARGLRTPFFTMVKDGVGVPRSAFTRAANAGGQRITDMPDPDGIAAAHADGATIVLQALHRVWPPLATFCRELAAELGHQTQCNVYVTPPGAQGFKPHHDTHDVLVLQVDGRKHWTIHPPVVELPLKSQPSNRLGPDPVGGRPPEVDVVLEPGDALYLPRGWLHSAQTTDERSIHLTVGLLATTWADVLTDLVSGAGEDDLALRHALRLPGTADGSQDVAAFRRAALAWLEGVDDAAVLRAVARRRRQAVPVEPVGALAQDSAARTLGPSTVLRPRAGLSASAALEGDRLVVRVADRSVSFPGWTGAAVRAALAGPTSASALGGGDLGIDEADSVVLLRRLVRERVLVPAEPLR